MHDEKQKQVGRAYRRKLHIKPVKEGSEPRYVKILHDKLWNISQVPFHRLSIPLTYTSFGRKTTRIDSSQFHCNYTNIKGSNRDEDVDKNAKTQLDF